MKISNEKIGKCIVCGNELVGEGVFFKNMPSGAQSMPTEENLSSDKGIDLELVICDKCGLTQFDTTPVDYYKKAIRVVGLSDYMKELRYRDFKLLDEKFGLKGKKVVEVGCGNGDFLFELEKYDSTIKIFGTCEDNDNIEKAKKKLERANVIKFFPENDFDILPSAPFDFFLSFNFLEHQPNPLTMLKVIYNSLNENGIGLITVPAYEYIEKNSVYYELIRDHIANYDINSLRYLCNLAGFIVLKEEYISIGDTIRFIVKKDITSNVKLNGIKKTKKNINIFKESYININKKIDDIVFEYKKNNKTIALWGAGHQGFTIAATTNIKDVTKYFIDSSSDKEGKYSPVSHIKIVKPEYYKEDKVDTILIVAPAYIKEIRNTVKKIYGDSVNVMDILNIQGD